MDKERINRILQITIGLVIGFILLNIFQGADFLSINGLKKISSVFGYVILFWTFYFSVGWKWPILKYLSPTENLNGTWFGKYESCTLEGEKFEGEISVVIRQTFLWTTVVSYTEHYLSYSYGEAILENSKNKSSQLIYLYSQNQYNPTDNLSRRGTSELHLLKELKKSKLFGEFWTNHHSQGSLTLEKKTSKHLTSFIDAKQHPTK